MVILLLRFLIAEKSSNSDISTINLLPCPLNKDCTLLTRRFIGEIFIGVVETLGSFDIAFSNQKFSAICVLSYYLR
jgi:hypothetical protein